MGLWVYNDRDILCTEHLYTSWAILCTWRRNKELCTWDVPRTRRRVLIRFSQKVLAPSQKSRGSVLLYCVQYYCVQEKRDWSPVGRGCGRSQSIRRRESLSSITHSILSGLWYLLSEQYKKSAEIVCNYGKWSNLRYSSCWTPSQVPILALKSFITMDSGSGTLINTGIRVKKPCVPSLWQVIPSRSSLSILGEWKCSFIYIYRWKWICREVKHFQKPAVLQSAPAETISRSSLL